MCPFTVGFCDRHHIYSSPTIVMWCVPLHVPVWLSGKQQIYSCPTRVGCCVPLNVSFCDRQHLFLSNNSGCPLSVGFCDTNTYSYPTIVEWCVILPVGFCDRQHIYPSPKIVRWGEVMWGFNCEILWQTTHLFLSNNSGVMCPFNCGILWRTAHFLLSNNGEVMCPFTVESVGRQHI